MLPFQDTTPQQGKSLKDSKKKDVSLDVQLLQRNKHPAL